MNPLKQDSRDVIFGEISEVLGDHFGHYIALVGLDDGRIQQCNSESLDSSSNPNMERLSDNKINSIALCSDLNSIICGGENGNVFRVSWPEADEVTKIVELDEPVLRVSCATKGTITLVMTKNHVHVVDYAMSSIVHTVASEKNLIWAQINQNGEYFAYASAVLERSALKQLVVCRMSDFSNVLEEKVFLVKPTISWGYPSVLIVGDSNKSLFFTRFDIGEGKKSTFQVKGNGTSFAYIVVTKNMKVSAFDTKNNISVFGLPPYHENGTVVEIVPDYFQKIETSSNMSCIGCYAQDIIAGNEEGCIFRFSYQSEEKIGDDDSKEEEDLSEELSIEIEKDNKKTDAFGGLKPFMKDTHQITKKTIKKAKDRAKQKKLDLTEIKSNDKGKTTPAKTAPNPTPKIKMPPSKKQDALDLIDDFSTEDEEESDDNKFDESDSQNVSWVDKLIHEDAQEKEPKEDEKIDGQSFSESDNNNLIDSTQSSEVEQLLEPPRQLQEINTTDTDPNEILSEEKKESVDTISIENDFEQNSSIFMPTMTSKNSDNSRILSWNAYYCSLYGTTEYGEPYIRLYKNDSPNTNYFKELIGHDVVGTQFACTSENSLLIASSNEYFYCIFSPEDEDNLYEIRGIVDANEIIVLIAVGSSWFAMATNMNLLHIFDDTGSILISMELDSRPISIIGHENLLFIITGGNHQFELMDIEKKKSLTKGLLAGKQPLRWIGFDAGTNKPLMQSGDNIVYCLTDNFGSYWTPVADLKSHFTIEYDRFYSTFAKDHVLFGILTNKKSEIPATMPLPTLTSYDLYPMTLNKNHYMFASLDDYGSDSELIKKFTSALNEKRFMRAVHISAMVKDPRIKNEMIKIAYKDNNPNVANRIANYNNEDTLLPSKYNEKIIEKKPFKRSCPPPEDQEEEDEENPYDFKKLSTPAKTVPNEENEVKKSIFEVSHKPRINSEDELLDELDSIPAKPLRNNHTPPSPKINKSNKTVNKEENKSKQRKSRKPSGKSDEQVDDEDDSKNKKSSKRRKRLADASTSSGDENIVEDDTQQASNNKAKTKKDLKKRKSKKLVGNRGKIDDLSLLSSFGFK